MIDSHLTILTCTLRQAVMEEFRIYLEKRRRSPFGSLARSDRVAPPNHISTWRSDGAAIFFVADPDECYRLYELIGKRRRSPFAAGERVTLRPLALMTSRPGDQNGSSPATVPLFVEWRGAMHGRAVVPQDGVAHPPLVPVDEA